MSDFFEQSRSLPLFVGSVVLVVVCPFTCLLVFCWARRSAQQLVWHRKSGSIPCSAASLTFEIVPPATLLIAACLALSAQILSFWPDRQHQTLAKVLVTCCLGMSTMLLPVYLLLGIWRNCARQAGRRAILASICCFYTLPPVLLIAATGLAAAFTVIGLESDASTLHTIGGLPSRAAIVTAAVILSVLICMCHFVFARLSLRWLRPSSSTIDSAGATSEHLDVHDEESSSGSADVAPSEMRVEDFDVQHDMLRVERRLHIHHMRTLGADRERTSVHSKTSLAAPERAGVSMIQEEDEEVQRWSAEAVDESEGSENEG